MSRRAKWWIGAALAATIVLGMPVAASASRTYIRHAGFVTDASIRGTHGFTVKVAENDRRRVEVTVTGKHTMTSYESRAKSVVPGQISGGFDKRGRFDLHFVPAGKPIKLTIPRWCTGTDASLQRGHLIGRFRFRAERAFTEVRGDRVPAAFE